MKDTSGFMRQWKIVEIIAKSPNGITLAQLAQHFQVCLKTIRRDIKLLRSVPVALKTEYEDGRSTFYYDFANGVFPINFTHDELLSFYVGRNLMEPLKGTYFWESLQNGIVKIRQLLNRSSIDYAERVSPLFYCLDRSSFDYKDKQVEIDSILVAMEDQRIIEIKYQSVHSDRPKVYKIHPYNFIYQHGFIYIVGYSCKDEEIRFWKINRLKSVNLLSEKFTRPDDFSIEKYMSKAFCPFISEEGTVKIVAIFKKSVAPIVKELAWDSFKEIKERKDGSLKVTMEMEGGKPLLHWLMGFGADVQIISPKSFREIFIKKLKAVLDLYESEDPASSSPVPTEEDRPSKRKPGNGSPRK
ncbi:MAG: transcriptional regulator [Planctomycetia bacterium]|nr:transcriptional regulator [Planctomycetia bacterium]